jgi:hypothetical protein
VIKTILFVAAVIVVAAVLFTVYRIGRASGQARERRLGRDISYAWASQVEELLEKLLEKPDSLTRSEDIVVLPAQMREKAEHLASDGPFARAQRERDQLNQRRY